MSDLVLTERLVLATAGQIPSWWTAPAVLSSDPEPEFVPDPGFVFGRLPAGTRRRDRGYDLGRVHYFVLLLLEGQGLEPISIESECYQYRVGSPITWGSPEIIDGRHRLKAYQIAGVPRIPILFDGLVESLQWLKGC